MSIIGIAAILLIGGALSSCPHTQSDHAATVASPPPAATIPYTVVEDIPAGTLGHSRVLLVSSKYRNEQSLRLLASDIVALSSEDRFALVVVFDNPKAAAMFHDPPEEGSIGRFYDRHFLLTYNKNTSTHYNHIQITPHGLDGRDVNIYY